MKTQIVLISLACLYIAWATVPDQSSCDPAADGVACSNSSYCACQALLAGGAVCTQQMNCDYATPCNATNTCTKAGTHCVVEKRCGGASFCYAESVFSLTVCPSVSVSSDGTA